VIRIGLGANPDSRTGKLNFWLEKRNLTVIQSFSLKKYTLLISNYNRVSVMGRMRRKRPC
jgi:hypothetical protein